MSIGSIISGARDDLRARTLRTLLGGFSVPYRLAIQYRNRRYDSGAAEVLDCGVPVISVGNLTTGGTGKTPLVCYLAKRLRQQGKQVAMISRGYGSSGDEPNDEARELAARLPDVPHVQNPDRVAAAAAAVDRHGAEIILMDDGFQHRRLHRDLDIVVIDASCPFGFGHLLPRGLLREPISGLRRAGLVVLTRCGGVGEAELVRIEDTIRQHHPTVPILRSDHQPRGLLTAGGESQTITPQPVAALSAIGNPAAFEASLSRCGLTVRAAKRLPDHDRYSARRIEEIEHWIRTLRDPISAVICTHKDLVKLQRAELGGKPLKALLIELQLQAEPDSLDALLADAVRA